MMPQAQARFADADLTLTHWIALLSLRDSVARTCSDIARHLGHDTGATTRLIDQLESRGLVLRRRDDNDRRIVNLTLTAAGRIASAELTPRVIQYWNDMLANFTAAEATTLIELLARLLTRMEAEPTSTAERPQPQPPPKHRARKRK